VNGVVDGRRVCVGASGYVDACVSSVGTNAASAPSATDGMAGLRAHIAVDGTRAGEIEFADQLRPGLPAFFAELRALGVDRTVLLSGDSEAHTLAVAREVGIQDARGELTPDDKVTVVRHLVQEGARVVMIGDGTNDAPALSAASVGIALAGHGGGITAEAADVVLLNDDPSHVAEVIRIGRCTLRIARQSIRVGLGLSAAAMLVAAAGYLPPVAGALLQEAIDVAVILNALRASR